MSILFSGAVGMGYNGSWVIDDTLGCTTDEEYLEDPQAVGSAVQIVDNVNYGYSYIGVDMTSGNRHCFYLRDNPSDSNVKQLTSDTLPNGHRPAFIISYNNERQSICPGYRINSTYGPDVSTIVSTNLPIFLDLATAQSYVSPLTSDTEAKRLIKEHALNYKSGEVSPEGQEFRLEVQWTTSTWTNDNQPTVTGQPGIQSVRGKITDGKFALYKIEGIDDGKLKYGIKNTASFYDLEYSNDGVNWTPTDVFPYNFIYRKRENELGTFSYALSSWNTDIPIWDNEDDADDYIDDILKVNDAPNWPSISGQYPPENFTGVVDDITEFGNVYTRSFFTQQYICDTNAIQDISNALYDTNPGGIWEDIKKGLDMFGGNPMDAVVSLMYYPLNLNTVFTQTQSAPSIWFGGYEHQLSQGSANKILYPDGSFSVGTVNIKRTFKNWRDIYATKLYVDLPYCGYYELDPTKYYDKVVEVRYFIDTHTGGCCACLIADGHCYDQFNGQMGTQLPITLTDFSAYANSQINTLLGNGGQSVNSAMQVGETGAKAGAMGSALGVTGAGVGAAALGAVHGAKTVYGLAQNNINKFNQTRGASSAMLNQYLNQKVTFTFETLEMDIPSNFYQLNGGATNAGGRVGSFTGYLECDQVKLNVQGATENEKAQIRNLLLGGVFI